MPAYHLRVSCECRTTVSIGLQLLRMCNEIHAEARYKMFAAAAQLE